MARNKADVSASTDGSAPSVRCESEMTARSVNDEEPGLRGEQSNCLEPQELHREDDSDDGDARTVFDSVTGASVPIKFTGTVPQCFLCRAVASDKSFLDKSDAADKYGG